MVGRRSGESVEVFGRLHHQMKRLHFQAETKQALVCEALSLFFLFTPKPRSHLHVVCVCSRCFVRLQALSPALVYKRVLSRAGSSTLNEYASSLFGLYLYIYLFFVLKLALLLVGSDYAFHSEHNSFVCS